VSAVVPSQNQALACHRRSWDAVAVVAAPAPADPQLRHLTEPPVIAGRSSAGFNPARRAAVRLVRAVLEGDPLARGVRHRALGGPWFGHPKRAGSPPRASAAVGRLFHRRPVRQLGAKKPRPRRGRVTERGRQLLGLAVHLYRSTWPPFAVEPAGLALKTSPHLAEKFRGKKLIG
jgi:hypothetical protein